MEQTVKCPICGKPFVVYNMYCGDQSACPECRVAARQAVKRESTWEEIQRRNNYFGRRGYITSP